MRYDQGYGRQGGWETRMPDGGRGWDQGYPDPRRGGDPVDRPWVGGYREGYQGGSGGYALRTTGPLYESHGAPQGPENHERGYRRPRGAQGRGQQGRGYFVRARAGYGSDFGGRDSGDRFAYEDAAGGTGFGQRRHPDSRQNAGGGRHDASRGGGYGGDFAFRMGGYDRGMRGGATGGGYDRGMRGGATGYDRGMRGGGGYDRPFRGQGLPEWPRWS